eukprot:418776_1
MSTNEYMSLKQEIYICLTLLIWLILSPIMIRWSYQIWKNRQTLIMQKRYINISMTCCAICILCNIITIPLDLDMFFTNIPHLYSLSHAIISSIIHYCIFYLLSQRFYMLFFNINWTIITLSSHWIIHIRKPSTKIRQKAIALKALNITPNYSAISSILPARFCENIDPDIVEKSFIKYQSKYGSIKNVHKITTLFYMCTSILYTLLCAVIYFFTNNNIWQHALNCIFLLLPCCIIFYLWTKIPNNINDQFFFYQEMHKLLIIISITCFLKLFLYIIAIIYTYVTYFQWYFTNFNLKISQHIITMLSCFLIVYYQTQWILNQIENQKQIYNKLFPSTCPSLCVIKTKN